MEGDIIVLQDIFRFEQKGVDDRGRIIGEHQATGIIPKFLSQIEAEGIKLGPDVFAGR